MDGRRVGRSLRAIRLRREERQVDVSVRAGVSREVYGLVEAGDLAVVSVAELDAICAALDATLDVFVRWRGTELDRLLNAGHSAMHEEIARRLVPLGWTPAPEVSFAIHGERGIIDILAWHAETRTLLVIEIKTEIVDIQALIGRVDTYWRLAPAIARARGWDPLHVGAWVVVAESATNRRRLAAHRLVLRAAFAADGTAVNAWLRRPVGPLKGLSMVAIPEVAARTAARGSRRRVRLPQSRPSAPAGPRAIDQMSRAATLRGDRTAPGRDSAPDEREERLVDLSRVARGDI